MGIGPHSTRGASTARPLVGRSAELAAIDGALAEAAAGTAACLAVEG